MDEGEVRFVDQAIVGQLRQLSSENRQAYKAMSHAQRIRSAGARAAEQLRGYRYKGDAWSDQDKEDLRVRLEREIVKAGGKVNVALEDNAEFIAEYQDRVLSFALNKIQGKTINGIMKALQGTLSHELLHWARSMGFYSPDQWAELVNAVNKRKMARGDAERTGKLVAWQELRDKLGRMPTYQEYADLVYSDEDQWIRQEEAVAAAMETSRARYEQENADANATIWRKALGSLIKMGRAVVRAVGSLTQNQQSKLQEYLNRAERSLRSGATARQAPAFDQAGLEPSQRIKVQNIKETVNRTFQTEEINDLIRRIEDPNVTAAEIAAAPIWGTLAELQDGPTVTPQQVADLSWWSERQYPHPDGSDQLLTPQEMVQYIKSSFEGAVAKTVKQQKRATLVSGAPGAGKSTLIKQIAKRQNAAVIATDEVRPFIPEYNDGINTDDVANEARALTMQAYRELTLTGTNVVREVIGEDIENLTKAVAYLKDLGYSVDIVHVRADFTTRMRRMSARFLATGRPIAINDMIRIGNRPSYVHRAAARMQIGDGFYEVESGQRNGYRIISRSGKPRPGTTNGVRAASGGRVAGVGRFLGGERPTVRLKELATSYAQIFAEWNKTAGYGQAMNNFGGVRARGADLTALQEAQKLAKEGVDANTIRLKTGWFRPLSGKGKWRFTISDGQIKLKPALLAAWKANPAGSATSNYGLPSSKPGKLEDYIDTPLFALYPQLRKVNVYVDRGYPGAAANPFLNSMIFGKAEESSSPQEVFAHEIQHLISNYEKFEKGGNAFSFHSLSQRGWNRKPPSWALSLALDYKNYDTDMHKAIATYLALTDEVQARDAEAMVNMTPEERAAYQPTVTTKETLNADEIVTAWDHLRTIPLKWLAAIPPTGLGIGLLIDYLSMQSFKPADALNAIHMIATEENLEQSPVVHQEFGLTREQSKSFTKMRAYAPVAKAMEEIGIPADPKRITRDQYAKLKRRLDAISDLDFVSDDMSTAKRIVGRRLLNQFLKDEKAFKAFLEHGVMDGGFVGTDRPQTPTASFDTSRVLYRGSKADEKMLKATGDNHKPVGPAIHLSPREAVAKEYGSNVKKYYIRGPLATMQQWKEAMAAQPTWSVKERGWDGYDEHVAQSRLNAQRALQAQGYTGVQGQIAGGPYGADEVAIFDPKDLMPADGGAMQSRRYTPPGGRFGATTSSTNYTEIGPQPGFQDDVAYVAQQLGAIPKKTGIGGTIIQDKRMRKLRPWNIAGGKLDELDKLVEGSLRSMWGNIFRNIPILQQIAGKGARYFQFGGVPDQAALEILRTMFQGRVGQAEQLAADLAREVSKGLNIRYEDAWKVLRGDFSGLAKLDVKVQEDAKDKMAKLKQAMTEEDPAKQQAMLAALPAELQAAGKRAMTAIQEVGDALVEHKIISKRQRDKWSGHYLLRAYMEHIDTYRPPVGTRASGAPYRAWRNAIPKDKRLTKGEIESLPFLLYLSIERPLHDIAAYSYLNSLMHHSMNSPSNPRWFLPDSLVLFGGKWRSLFYVAKQMKQSETSLNQKKAELSEIGGTSANSDLARNLRSEIRLLERVISDMKLVINANPAYASILKQGQLPDGYRQLPDDSGKYGDAAGGIVMEQIYNDITGGLTGFADETTIAGKAIDAWGAFNRNVKFLLTVANPPTHLRNIYSNILMLARSGTNPARVVQAIVEMAQHNGGKGKASPAIQAALKFGAMKQTFTEAELRVLDEFSRGIQNEIKKANFRKGVEGVFGQNTAVDSALSAMDLASAILGAAKNAYGDGMSWLYQNEDVIFKVAKIADELDRGTPPAVAALEARKYFFDYSAVTPVVRWLSNSAIAPFIRYTYFAVPNFLEQTFTSPWRLAYTGYGQYFALMALAALMWGFAPEEAKETMNEYLAERPMMVPVPWRDEHDRLQWIDLGYMLPEGALIGLLMAGHDADPQAALRALGATGGPATTIYIGASTGIDPFRGTPIYEETDSEETKAAKLSWFSLRSIMPSFFSYYTPPMPGEDKGGPGYEALWGTGVDRYGEPTQTDGQLASRALGVNVYPNDVVYGQGKRLRQFRWELEQIQQELDRTYRARDLTEEARARRVERLWRDFERVMQTRNEYIAATANAVEAEGRRQSE